MCTNPLQYILSPYLHRATDTLALHARAMMTIVSRFHTQKYIHPYSHTQLHAHTHTHMHDRSAVQTRQRKATTHEDGSFFLEKKRAASGGTRTHKGRNILQTMQLLCQCQTPTVVMHMCIFNHVINLQKSFPHKSVSRSPGYGPDPVPRRPWSGFGSYIVVTLACLVSSVISTNMPPPPPPPQAPGQVDYGELLEDDDSNFIPIDQLPPIPPRVGYRGNYFLLSLPPCTTAFPPAFSLPPSLPSTLCLLSSRLPCLIPFSFLTHTHTHTHTMACAL